MPAVVAWQDEPLGLPNYGAIQRMDDFDRCSPRMRAFLREHGIDPPLYVIQVIEQRWDRGETVRLEVNTPGGIMTVMAKPPKVP